ncbi:MAG: hypothetical protein IIB53_09770 [Planctomycetes bacterium]|nr:hypothetical protein [Planctomycetota bacterium]
MTGAQPTAPTLAEQRQALLEHFELSVRLHGERRASKMMRKFGIKFATHHPEPAKVKAEFIRCKSIADWHEVITQQYASSV